MKLYNALINSNIYISLAAVSLTIGTQIQLGMEPQWHPYLFIIFFATLFEYNLHRLITITTKKEALNQDKHKWVRDNLKAFYLLMICSAIGFICVVFLAKKEVLMALAPIALLTLFYSVPFTEKINSPLRKLRLREIPYLKIFLIAVVWSSSTILLPIIQTTQTFNNYDIIAMLAERFFFVFAITIPFDIRDIEVDKKAGLKTIPLLLSEKKSLRVSYILLLIFFIIALVHYHNWYMIIALAISTITTMIFLGAKKIKMLTHYHYGIIDGTMLLQGLLVLAFYYISIL